MYKTFKDKVTKIRSVALTNDETEPNDYLAILPCIPYENSHPQKISVELDDDLGQSAIGTFKFVKDKEQAIEDFGIHVSYIRLINKRCNPKCVLMGRRLDKGGERKIHTEVTYSPRTLGMTPSLVCARIVVKATIISPLLLMGLQTLR